MILRSRSSLAIGTMALSLVIGIGTTLGMPQIVHAQCDPSSQEGINQCGGYTHILQGTESLSASPTSVVLGQSSTLSWTYNGYSSTGDYTAPSNYSCKIEVDYNYPNGLHYSVVNGSVNPAGGTLVVTPGYGGTTATYYIDCSGYVNGSYSTMYATAAVTVGNPAPTASLTANPTSIVSGNASTLTWSSSNATSCTINNGANTGNATSGSVSVYPGSTTTYTVTCTGAGGTATSAATVNVTPALPDLTADTVPNITITLGQSATVTATIHNIGNGSTGGSFPNIFLTNLDGSGTYWHTVQQTAANTPALAAGGVTTSTLTFPASTFATAGTYVYDFCTDYNSSWVGSITESNENNNCAPAGYITVNAPPLPDLTADALPSQTITLGQSATVTATIRNIGNGSTNASFANIFVTNLNGSGTAWNTVQQTANTPTLAAGGVTTSSLTFPASTFATAGTYVYDFCTDYNSSWVGSITESNENNNCAPAGYITVNAPPLPDLTAGSITQTSAVAGTPISLSALTSNIGNASTGHSFNVGYAFDNQADHSTWYNRFGWVVSNVATLGAGSSAQAPITYTFPSAGTYYVIACADYDGTVTESNENNNCGAWTAITVAPAIPTSPTTVTASCAVDGTHVGLSWTAMPGATSYYPRMYSPTASQCTAFGWQVYSDGVTCIPNPDTGVSYTSFSNFPITPGQAYSAWVHSANSTGINPTPTYLNFSCAGLPNLTASTLAGASTVTGQSVNLSGTISNPGTGAAGAFPNIVQICDGNCATVNTAIYGTSYNSMAAGGSQAFSAAYTPTYSSATKQLYYRICANTTTSFTNAIAESNYGDDCGAFQALTVAPPAAPSCSASPSNPKVGDSVTYTATPGSGDTAPYTWTDSDGYTTTGNPITRTYSSVGPYSMSVMSANGSPAGYCSNVTVGCTGTPTASLSSSAARVKQGTTVSLTLGGQNVNTSCVLTANGAVLQTNQPPAKSCVVGPSNYTTPGVQEQTKYCYACDGGAAVCTVVNVIPAFKEF